MKGIEKNQVWELVLGMEMTKNNGEIFKFNKGLKVKITDVDNDNDLVCADWFEPYISDGIEFSESAFKTAFKLTLLN